LVDYILAMHNAALLTRKVPKLSWHIAWLNIQALQRDCGLSFTIDLNNLQLEEY